LDGQALDAFVDYKDTVENVLGLSYDVNDYLAVGYTIESEEDVIYEDELVILSDEGEFSLSLEGLENGDYTLTLQAVDIAGNQSEESFEFEVETAPEPYDLFLTPDTTEDTEGPVIVTVDSDSESDLTTLKYLAGDRTEEDFEDNGHDIDLESSSFEVEENGLYTVFSINEEDVTAIAQITIDNIVDPDDGGDDNDNGDDNGDNNDDDNGDNNDDGNDNDNGDNNDDGNDNDNGDNNDNDG